MNRIFLAAAILAPLAASAADGMRPGLYHYTMKMEVPGMPYAVPPMTMQHCLTQADLDKGKQYESQQNRDCETKNLRQSAGKVHYEMACKDGTTGTGDYAYTADGMTGKTVMVKDGQATTMTMSATRAGECK